MSISITRKLSILVLKHPKLRHVIKPIVPIIMKSYQRDYQRITAGPDKKQEQ